MVRIIGFLIRGDFMKNIFGDEREPEVLTFEYEAPHMTVKRGGKFAGMVSPNGWTGKTMMINYKEKEPVLSNYRGDLSLGEMEQILEQWKIFTTGKCSLCSHATLSGWSSCPRCGKDL